MATDRTPDAAQRATFGAGMFAGIGIGWAIGMYVITPHLQRAWWVPVMWLGLSALFAWRRW